MLWLIGIPFVFEAAALLAGALAQSQRTTMLMGLAYLPPRYNFNNFGDKYKAESHCVESIVAQHDNSS